jgi:hypothetical protein
MMEATAVGVLIVLGVVIAVILSVRRVRRLT